MTTKYKKHLTDDRAEAAELHKKVTEMNLQILTLMLLHQSDEQHMQGVDAAPSNRALRVLTLNIVHATSYVTRKLAAAKLAAYCLKMGQANQAEIAEEQGRIGTLILQRDRGFGVVQ